MPRAKRHVWPLAPACSWDASGNPAIWRRAGANFGGCFGRTAIVTPLGPELVAILREIWQFGGVFGHLPGSFVGGALGETPFKGAEGEEA